MGSFRGPAARYSQRRYAFLGYVIICNLDVSVEAAHALRKKKLVILHVMAAWSISAGDVKKKFMKTISVLLMIAIIADEVVVLITETFILN